MQNEISALHDNSTWDLVRRPSDVPVIDSKWVYKIKRDTHGVVKYKARLVARGFTQKYGENYWDTYAPVVRNSSIRLLLACAVEYGLIVEQVDVRNAYVKSELNERIYMKQPRGFEQGGDLVCKLKKSLYGLKQAGHEWNKCFNKYLVDEQKFKRLISDPCVYIKSNKMDTIIVSVYVDDILIICKNRAVINEFKRRLNDRFAIEDIGECRRIIGIEVKQDGQGIFIHQRNYTVDILKTFGMQDCNPAKTPLSQGEHLECQEESCENCDLVDSTYYRAIVGKLSFLAMQTRPDIAFAVSSLARFNNNPHKKNLIAAKHVLRYLKGTVNCGIRYERKNQKLYAFSDADWANCSQDRKSYTGFLIWFGGAPISWASRKQQTVALSSTEAEYMALGDTAKEVLFTKEVMRELGFQDTCSGPIKIYGDNIGSIHLANKNGCHGRTKHIDTRHHFIRGLIEDKRILLEYCSTNNMLADICTKGLGSTKHRENMNRIMVQHSGH